MPNICRFYLRNFYYKKACENDKGVLLEKHVINVREGDVFRVDDYATVKVIETPGHLEDHLCFLLEAPGEPSYLFTGDHILGSKTVRALLV